MLVHGLAQQLAEDPSRKPDSRIGRHFYDIHELLADSGVIDFLADRAQVDQVIESIEETNQKHFKHDTLELRPATGFADSTAFDRDADACSRLRDAYESTMPELYFGSSRLPSWDSVCDRVGEMRDLL